MRGRDHAPSEELDLLIDTINDMDIGWKADTCKYQKHHPKRGAHCDKQELAQYTRPALDVEFGSQPNFSEALTEA